MSAIGGGHCSVGLYALTEWLAERRLTVLMSGLDGRGSGQGVAYRTNVPVGSEFSASKHDRKATMRRDPSGLYRFGDIGRGEPPEEAVHLRASCPFSDGHRNDSYVSSVNRTSINARQTKRFARRLRRLDVLVASRQP
jgi:hypothetical protein